MQTCFKEFNRHHFETFHLNVMVNGFRRIVHKYKYLFFGILFKNYRTFYYIYRMNQTIRAQSIAI